MRSGAKGPLKLSIYDKVRKKDGETHSVRKSGVRHKAQRQDKYPTERGMEQRNIRWPAQSANAQVPKGTRRRVAVQETDQEAIIEAHGTKRRNRRKKKTITNALTHDMTTGEEGAARAKEATRVARRARVEPQAVLTRRHVVGRNADEAGERGQAGPCKP